MLTKIQKKDKRERIRQKRENKKKLIHIACDNALSDCYSVILSNKDRFTDQDINNASLVSKTFYDIISKLYSKIKIVRLVRHCMGNKKDIENAFVLADSLLSVPDIFSQEADWIDWLEFKWNRIVFTKIAATNDLQIVCHSCKKQRGVKCSSDIGWCYFCAVPSLWYDKNNRTKFNTNDFI